VSAAKNQQTGPVESGGHFQPKLLLPPGEHGKRYETRPHQRQSRMGHPTGMHAWMILLFGIPAGIGPFPK